MKYNSFQRDFCFIINSNDSMIAEEEVGKVRSTIKKNGTEGGYNGNSHLLWWRQTSIIPPGTVLQCSSKR